MRPRYKDLSLQQLRTYCEVCRRSSYAEAARHLQLSTSAVWEQVRGLERYVGIPLLESLHGQLQPTVAGRQLLELVGPHVSGLDATRETLHQLRGRSPQQIRVVSGVRMLSDEVMRAAAQFREKYPDISLQLLYIPDDKIDAVIERREADLGLVIERPSSPARAALVVHEPAYELDFVLVTPRQHPLASRSRLRLADILKHPLVVGTSGTATRSWIDHVMYQHGLANDVRIAVETNSSSITFAAVRCGVGVGIAASPVAGSLTTGLAVRSLGRWFPKARYMFVWNEGTQLLPVHHTLADLIRQCAMAR